MSPRLYSKDGIASIKFTFEHELSSVRLRL